jgi:pyrimidine operon attenuation protein / uracil phosphoribosyltransferase
MNQVLMHSLQLTQTVCHLAKQIASRHRSPKDVIVVGIQQGGVALADEIIKALSSEYDGQEIPYGQLDITFYRDDIRNKIIAPDAMHLPFSIEGKTIVLIDDILFTGRTIKAALDALLDYGRPGKVELCVLIDRKEHRQFPIQADFVGATLPTSRADKIKLLKNKEGQKEVVLIVG